MIGWPCVLINGLLLLAAWWIAAFGLRRERGVDRALAAAVLAWVWSTLGMQALGTLGLLRVEWLFAWVAPAVIVGAVCRFRRGPGDAESGATLPNEPTQWEGIAAVALIGWAVLTLLLPSLLMPVKVVSDGPIYHLYFAARWWKAGQLFLVASPFGESAATYFPANGDLWFSWLMVGWGGDRLAKIGQAPFLPMAMLAAFGCAREVGASRASALIASALFAASSPMILFAFEANVDAIFIAGYITAAFFILRFARRPDDGIALMLGGLAAGESLGTKSVGLVFVPPLALAALWIIARRAGSIRRAAGLAIGFVAAVLATSGFWFARNALLTGNPLYPLRVQLGGATLLQGWYGREAMRESVYYIPVEEWRAFVDILVGVLDPRLAPLWLAAVAGLWALGRRSKDGATETGWVWVFGAGALLNVALYWLLIPYRTQPRFMLQALGMAVVPLARLLDRGRWLRAAAVALLLVHMLTPQAWPLADREEDIPWDLDPRIPNSFSAVIPLMMRLQRLDVLGALATLALGVVAAVVAWRLMRAGSGVQSLATWGVLAGALGVVAAVGWFDVWRLSADPRMLIYPPFPEFYAGWMQLEARSGPNGSRVAYAGTNIPYYLMGAGLRNHVEYVNINAHRDWLMHDYHRESLSEGRGEWPNSRPGWDREQADYDAWLANLEARGIQLLVVTRVNPNEGPHNVADADLFPIERQWADAHPESFEPLYGAVEQDPWFRLYRVRPRGGGGP